MNQVKHRICCNRLERNTGLFFYRNALSFGNGHSIKDTPVQLCYPDVSTTLGFHPHSFNLFQGLNLDFEDEVVLDRPSLIIPTEYFFRESSVFKIYQQYQRKKSFVLHQLFAVVTISDNSGY
ncbi:hypothetical protein OJ253_914 [Cryptosporidium canis]|uniref:Uncharacterized protein n=1 Tax=Cryptosporidium canis TaxID=195482 RepID=A0A9D5HY04_9CRYT|nr:hypothetical protein OJ253_914 [Cryptosporidium canis]